MTATWTKAWAIKAAEAIFNDISDRRGFRQTIDDIDDEIQQEIKDEWADIIAATASDQEPQQVASGESPPVITPQEAALLPDTDAGRSNEPAEIAEAKRRIRTASKMYHNSAYYWGCEMATDELTYWEWIDEGIDAIVAVDPSRLSVPRELLERSISRDPDVCYVAIKELRAMLKQEKP